MLMTDTRIPGCGGVLEAVFAYNAYIGKYIYTSQTHKYQHSETLLTLHSKTTLYLYTVAPH